MVITKLKQRYAIGCGRGMSAVNEPNLQFILNAVIDWDNSITESGEPVPDPERFLEPGDCFCLGVVKSDEGTKARMILAMDSGDQIVCILNDTGILALQRIIEEKIKPEYHLTYDGYPGVSVESWEIKTTDTDLPAEGLVEIPIDKPSYRLWKERFVSGRPMKFPEGYLEVTFTTPETLGIPVRLFLTKYVVFSEESCMFTEIPGFLSDAFKGVLGWLWNEIPVLPSA